MKKYLVIERYEDETYLSILTKEELEKKMDEQWKDGSYKFLGEKDFDGDLMTFPSRSVLIMEGEVKKPKIVRVIEKFEI